MGGFILIILCLAVYFLPYIIGYNKKNSGSIFALNLLLGWTLIGWVVALVWALAHEEDSKPVEAKATAKPQTLTDELLKLDELRQKGIITQEEFDAQKTKLLNN